VVFGLVRVLGPACAAGLLASKIRIPFDVTITRATEVAVNGVLAGVVGILGAAAFLNLLLTYGVMRRLRDHEERLVRGSAARHDEVATLQPGTTVPTFTATTTDGTEVTDRTLGSDIALVGFFSPDCQPCREQLPRFATVGARLDPSRVLCVVSDDRATGTELEVFVEPMRGAGLVVAEGSTGSLAAAFGVRALPTMLKIEDGVVSASGHNVESLAMPAANQCGGEEEQARLGVRSFK
jgi:thiol-disulfide isomerase/thioredoxin